MSKSLNRVARDYREQLVGSALRGQAWSQFEARCFSSNATVGDWQFDRDETNARQIGSNPQFH